MTPYLRLARVQNLPTAAADVLAGYVIWAGEKGAFRATTALALVAASAALYSAGMVLNDVADVERDRTLHPERPLVKGDARPGTALALGAGLLALGLLLAMGIGFGAAFVATQIALLVVLYDFALKRFRLPGCVCMGLLRGLNFALGMGALWEDAPPLQPVLRDPLLHGPMLLATYVTLLTLLSTFEEGRGARVGVPSTLVALSCVPMAALFLVREPRVAGIAAAAFALAILGCAARAVRRFDPSRTGLLVRDGVRAIPLLDGIVVLGYGRTLLAVAVMCLVVPAVVLGRWFKGS